MVDVAIIGAGPYGLSIAAHLAARGVDFRIFGSPMHTWLTHMPKGMHLKSEGFASSLFDPESAFTLKKYCEQERLPYADLGRPVELQTFSTYGLQFQKRFVAGLENESVVTLDRVPGGFRIGLGNGTLVAARKVVAAVGLSHFDYVPPSLSPLPKELVTHSSAKSTFEHLRGREVTVIGGGSSATDIAASLLDFGASVKIVARKPVIHFHNPPGRIPRPLVERVRYPMTGLGPSWRSLFCTEGPLLFRQMPERFRLEVVRRHLGPSAGWFVKDRIVGRVPFHLGLHVMGAEEQNGRVRLDLADATGDRQSLVSDHVIAATGYRVDLRRLEFLSSEIAGQIRSVENTPVLSSNFESSVPGLYFVGTASANTFGPLVRFAFGAGFTARRLAKHLARVRSQVPIEEESPVAA